MMDPNEQHDKFLPLELLSTAPESFQSEQTPRMSSTPVVNDYRLSQEFFDIERLSSFHVSAWHTWWKGS
jgi:hypothetical protein